MSKSKKRFTGDFLEPLKTKKKSKREKFAVLDIESKADDTQRAGFTRPFLTGFYDPHSDEYVSFRDEPHLADRPWDQRHILPGGCVDKLLNYILDPKYKGWIIYAHYGGSFDYLHLVTWLQNHKDEYAMEIVPVQSSIQILRVWQIPKDENGDFDPEADIKYRWDFLDTHKLLSMPLEQACKAFGIQGKNQQNLNEHETHWTWEPYLEQDCRALAQVVLKLYALVEDRLGGEVGVTTPSTSIKLFRRCFQGKDECPAKINRYSHWPDCKERGDKDTPATCLGCAHAWILRGYYGGRTEIFRTFGEGLHYYDFNSSYVASMKDRMPIGKRFIEIGKIDWRRFHKKKGSPEWMKGSEQGRYSGFAEVRVYIPPECEVPPLPYRSEANKKLIFPAGEFGGVWSLEELALLDHPLVQGKILEIKKTVWFQLHPMFKSMVDVLSRYRDKNQVDFDEGLSLLAKLLGNGGYGKFAMKKERMSVVFAKDRDEQGRCPKCEKLREATCIHCFLCDAETDNKRQICDGCEGSKCAMEDLAGDVWYRAAEVDADYIIPHISAHITSTARVRLWFSMIQVLELGGKLYYCDTDSILCNVVLPSSLKLGDLKDEYPDRGPIRYMAVQPKVYMIEFQDLNDEVDRRLRDIRRVMAGDDSIDCSTYDVNVVNDDGSITYRKLALEHYAKVTMKGFPPNMRTKDNLRRLKLDESIEWEQLEKVRTLARKGFRATPKMRRVKKSFQTQYDKRIFLAGHDPEGPTRPIVIGEDQLEASDI